MTMDSQSPFPRLLGFSRADVEDWSLLMCPANRSRTRGVAGTPSWNEDNTYRGLRAPSAKKTAQDRDPERPQSGRKYFGESVADSREQRD
jgi:hypothetical protein